MINKQIEEFNNWCKENKISIGQNMKTESIIIADWWIKRLDQQRQEFEKVVEKMSEKLDRKMMDTEAIEIINNMKKKIYKL